MQFSVMSASFLQPNILLCGTNEGDVYVLDTYGSTRKRETISDDNRYNVGSIGFPCHLDSSRWKHSEEDIEGIILKRFSNMFKHGITCIEYHPRLPSLIALGLCDGSVHLLFLEGENLEMKKTTFLFKLKKAVNQLQWLLVDAIKDQDRYKVHSTSFVERIWKTIYRAPYHSVLVGRSGEQICYTVVERKTKVMNLYKSGTNEGAEETNFHKASDVPEERNVDIHTCGIESFSRFKEANAQNKGNICAMLNVRWPLFEYFERELEYPTLTNFCRVRESLCIIRYSHNCIYLDICVPEVEGSDVTFSTFYAKIRSNVRGIPTSVATSPKQYNQTSRYIATNNEHLFTLNGQMCLNALGEFIAIGTNEGYVYTTSMLHIYNAVYQAIRISNKGYQQDSALQDESEIMVANNQETDNYTDITLVDVVIEETGVYRSPVEAEIEQSPIISIHSTSEHKNSVVSSMEGSITNDIVVADIDMASYHIGSVVNDLKWTPIWNDFTKEPSFIDPNNCCCTDDIIFALAVVTNDDLTLFSLKKENKGLMLVAHDTLKERCTSIQWIEGTLPNNMELWMWTVEGMQFITIVAS